MLNTNVRREAGSFSGIFKMVMAYNEKNWFRCAVAD